MRALLEALAGCPGGVGPLRAGQVHQVDLRQGLVGHTLQVAGLHEADREDCVGSSKQSSGNKIKSFGKVFKRRIGKREKAKGEDKRVIEN